MPYFTLFIAVWVYLRHYINLCILHATLTKFATVGPYTLDLATEQYKCWISQIVTFILLAALQSINLFWLFLIVRISYNIVFRSAVKDVRSDYEDDDEDEGIERVEGPAGGVGDKAEGARNRQGRGQVEAKAEKAAGLGRANGMLGAGAGEDGDGKGNERVEGLDEYVDIAHEEKKDR